MAKTEIDRRYACIAAWERSVAAATARAVKAPSPLSVWEVTIPIVFILSHFRNKALRERFTKNLFFTKTLALDGAREMKVEGISSDVALARIAERTKEVKSSDTRGHYAEEIRRMQLVEVGILVKHYAALLSAEGEDYPSLVRSAYPSREEYLGFLDELRRAEGKVYEAALHNLGDQGDRAVVLRMEEASEKTRRGAVERIFGEAREERP